MKKRFLLLISILLLSSKVISSDKISCQVHHHLMHNDDAIVSRYQFTLANGRGVLKINGRVESEGNVSAISREIIFTYQQEGNIYHAKNLDIRLLPIDHTATDLLAKHYPAFFYQKNQEITFSLNKLSNGSYIISFVAVPQFYCNKMT